jgi:hypothetical protein
MIEIEPSETLRLYGTETHGLIIFIINRSINNANKAQIEVNNRWQIIISNPRKTPTTHQECDIGRC